MKRTHKKGKNLPQISPNNAYFLMNYGLTTTHFDKNIIKCFKFCKSCFNEIEKSNRKSFETYKYDYKTKTHIKVKQFN